MKEFNESEHPRDNDGKFTDKNGNLNSKKEEFVKKYSSEPERDLREENIVSNKNNMSQQEWALWYKAVAENKKLGYWADELDSGEALLKIETKTSNKLVITSGTFEKPKAIAVYEFKNSDDLNDYIEVLKIYGQK